MELKDIQKPKYYSSADAAKAMDISRHTLFRMIRNGKIKGINIAKSGKRPIWGILAEDIQSYYDDIQNSIKRS